MSRDSIISISNLTPDMADHYTLSALVSLWREQGLQVVCGQEYAENAQVCILHHDKTCLDPASLFVPPEGVPVLNGKVLDISKSSFSVLQVTETDAWNGPVIIKTNLNHFGFPEHGEAERVNAIEAVCVKLRTRLSQRSWRLARKLPPGYYPVLERMDDVPGWVWNAPELIVEKFLPERTEDGLYGVRGWIFFGDKEYAYRNLATDPLVKVATTVSHEFFSEVPESLRVIRKQMGFDFGKFDYVEHDGQAFLLDANKTPSYASATKTRSPRVEALSKGIEVYL